MSQKVALTGVAQLAGRCPTQRRAAGSVPGQGMCRVAGFGPDRGAFKRQQINVCLAHRCFSHFLPQFPLSLKIKSLKSHEKESIMNDIGQPTYVPQSPVEGPGIKPATAVTSCPQFLREKIRARPSPLYGAPGWQKQDFMSESGYGCIFHYHQGVKYWARRWPHTTLSQ